MLAHRLGLIPLLVNPDLFQHQSAVEIERQADSAQDFGEFADVFAQSTLVFSLSRVNTSTDTVMSVYSDDLRWQALPGQKERGVQVRQLPRILLTKLAPGEHVELTAHACKGIGREHAKWSPVGTAAYRLKPRVVLREPVRGDKADELVALCPMKVFDIEEIGKQKKAIVADEFACTLCRECVRQESWAKIVQLKREPQHYVFAVESIGAVDPKKLFNDALDVLHTKCAVALTELTNIENK